MSIGENYRRVLEEVAAQCEKAHRDPSDVLLLAVSKTVGLDGVKQALDAGAANFGENRLEQLQEKYAAFPQVNWHFIGNIQSRRIKDIVPCAHLIHSLFEERHAQKISDAAMSLDKVQRVLVEVNVSGEASKSGLDPHETKGFIQEISHLPNVEVCGLMTMAPQGDLQVAHECFSDLKLLKDDVAKSLSAEKRAAFAELSMGMSEDWREAIECGSTIVRIGRAIFSDDFAC